MFRIMVYFGGAQYPLGPAFQTRDEAHWQLARWRQECDCRNGSAFTVEPLFAEADSPVSGPAIARTPGKEL
jgi:hypothetical protein